MNIIHSFFILSLITISFINTNCPVYKCLEGSNIGNKCKITTDTEDITTIQVKSCNKGKKCNSDGICDKPVNLLPGDVCESNEQCKSNLCDSSRCKGFDKDEYCYHHSMCDVGYFCLDKKCTPQVDSGDKYGDDYMCQTNEGCNKGQCIPYYSLTIGEETESSKYCESGISERIGDKNIMC